MSAGDTAEARIRPYLDGLEAGELRTTRCTACGTAQFPPRPVCPHCGATESAEWITASGRGTVWSWCVFHKAYLRPPAPQPPYTVAVVQLDEGSKLIAGVLGVERPAIGTPVRAVFDDDGGRSRVRFAVVFP